MPVLEVLGEDMTVRGIVWRSETTSPMEGRELASFA